MILNKIVMEFIGTFFLVMTIGMTVIEPGGAGNLAPLAIGAALIVMVFAGGHVSGAHYNPAVTVAITLRGGCPVRDILPYWVAQVIGAAAAAGAVLFLKGNPTIVAASPDAPRALLAELLFTFALCTVVLHVATAKGTSGNSFYGLAIGFTVMAGAFAVGPISGGVFNPAVAVGVTMMGLSAPSSLWIFLVANFGAAILAALVFRRVVAEEGS